MTEDDSDPFDRLDDDADREGDPFDRLGTPDEETDPGVVDDPADVAESGTGAIPEDDPFESRAGDSPAGTVPAGSNGRAAPDDTSADTGGDGAAAGPGVDDPFADVDAPEGDPFAAGTGAFEQVDVGEVDADAVWDALTADDDESEPAAVAESRYVEVSKHAYCEGCEYFSPPPDVACSHETAEIVEFVDVETVRLLDCPVVAERRDLEDP